jgi:hypothetical protein
MKRLEHMKECLMACVESQMTHLDQVDAKELGEVVDMIKDLEEAIYYCTITKAMKADEEEEKQPRHQQQGQMYNSGGGMNYYTPMYNDGAMYMDHQTNRMNGHMQPQHTQMRDAREGNSPMYRRMYMEGKHQKDPQKQMQELEDYVHELTNDIMEMIEDATPEEKQLLRQKITTLSTKIK